MKKEETFGARLKKLRENSKYTSQDELADAVGIARQTLSNYEKDTRKPDVEVIKSLSQALGISADYLVGLSHVPAPNETVQGIHKKTGLSESAINALVKYKEKSDDGKVAFSVILQVLSSFIESKDSLIEVARALVEYENIKTDLKRMEAVSNDVLLVSGEDAKKFLIYNIQQEILKILIPVVEEE